MRNRDDMAAWSASNIMDEILSCEKHMSSLYNTAANEASSNSVRKDFLNILNDVHQIQKDVFTIMQRRGLYQPQVAENREIAQAQQKYNQQLQQFQ